MALKEVQDLLGRADNIQSEYNRLLESRIQTIRSLEISCRKGEHVWLKISRPPIRYLGPPTYIEICQCCGFCCKTYGVYDINQIREALSTEIMLSTEKEDIRRMAIEEYGEKQDRLDSLKAQLTAVKKEMKEIIDMCQTFLGEKKPVNQSDDDGCYWKD